MHFLSSKKRSAWIALRRNQNLSPRDPPQAENPALQDSIFIYRKLCRGLLFLGKLRGCVRGEQYTGMQLLYVAAHERAEVCMRGLVCACGVVLVH